MNKIPDSVLTRLFSPQAKICLASRLPFFLFALAHRGSWAEAHSKDPTRKIPKQSLPTLKPQNFCSSSLFAHFTCTQNFIRCSKLSPHSILFSHQTWIEFFPLEKMQRKRFFSLSILDFYTRTPDSPTSTFVFPSFSSGKCPRQPRKPAP